MLNFVFEPSTVLGLEFGSSIILLYIIRFFHPRIAFDEDILLTSMGLVYSSILIIHGWRLDPILIFSQILIVFINMVAGYSILRLRAITYILCYELDLNLKLDSSDKSFLFWTKSINPVLKNNKK